MRILFTGGGTGGHIYPILAVTEKLKEAAQNRNIDLNLFYIGVPENYTSLMEANGIKVSKISSVKLRRYFDLRNIIDFFKLPFAIIQAFWKVFFIMPDVLFSKSGTGALPVVLACKFYNIPIIIHESDSIAGMTNLISSRYADRIGISFASALDSFVAYYKNEKEKQIIISKAALIGNPVRNFLISKGGDQSAAKKAFGFDEKKPLILIICGSQGAVKVNDFFLNFAKDLVLENFQVLHQTGVKNFEGFRKELNESLRDYDYKKDFYKPVAYFDENIKDAYIAADIVISRSGSGSVFEIAAMGKPSILIPLAESASDHQRKNAYEYANTKAAIVIEETNLKSSIFITQLRKIFSNPDNLRAMSEAAASFAKPEASQILAEEILKMGENS